MWLCMYMRRALFLAHRARTRVGQEIDEDILRLESEHVIACFRKPGFTRITRDQADRLSHFNAEGFGG